MPAVDTVRREDSLVVAVAEDSLFVSCFVKIGTGFPFKE